MISINNEIYRPVVYKRHLLKTICVYLIFIFLLSYVAYFVQQRIPIKSEATIDWIECFRPGGLKLIAGENPHTLDNCNYMTWSLIPILPVTVLPPDLGRALMASISFLVFAYAANKLGASWKLAAAMVLLTPYGFHQLLNPNIDWMVALGFILPPQIGLFFVLVKPQLGIGVAVFWLYQAWQKGRIREVIRIFSPVTIVLLVSFLLYGFYLLPAIGSLPGVEWNMSFWPFGIPFGLFFIYYSLKKKQIGTSILGAPFLSPYVGYYSWPVSIIGLSRKWQIVVTTVMFLFEVIVFIETINK